VNRTLVFIKGLAAGALGTLIGGAATRYMFSRVGLIHFRGPAVSSPG